MANSSYRADDAGPRKVRAAPNPELQDRLVRVVTGATRAPSEKVARLLAAYPLAGELEAASEREIRTRGGLTKAQARKLHEAFELVRVYESWGHLRRGRPVRSPADAAELGCAVIRRLCGGRQEVFLVLALTSRGRLQFATPVAMGSLAQVDVHPRELFRPLLSGGVHACVLLHNHPSGDPTPSEADFDLTQRMVEVGRLVGIPVLDHVVITMHGQAHSMAQWDPHLFGVEGSR